MSQASLGAPYGGAPYGGGEVKASGETFDVIAFSDSTALSGPSDVIAFSDSASYSAHIAPLERIPGTYAQAGQPRRRNPVNAPRTWGKSVVRKVPGVVYHASDTIAFSDSAGVPPSHASDALTFSDTTSGPGYVHASDSIAFSDVAKPHGLQTHLTGSDILVFSDVAIGAGGLMPQPSVMKLMPGVGARATPRTRNPVNFPRTFRTSRVKAPEQLSYGAYDTIIFSDTATRPPRGYSLSGADSISFSDGPAKEKFATADSIIFSDAAVGHKPSDAAADSFTFVDSAYGFKTFVRTATDTLSFSDVALRDLVGSSTDTLAFSDAAQMALEPADTIPFSDTAAKGPMSYTRHTADSISFSDTAIGTPGRNNLTASDTLHFHDSTWAYLADTFTFSDSAVAGIVFFAGYDSLTFSDTATPAGYATHARIYQVYGEVIFQATGATGYAYQAGLEVIMKPPSTGYEYQAGLEVMVKPPAQAEGFQLVEEVLVGQIYGQIWPIGWGQTRRRYGQLWPRWSRKYGGGMAED